MVDTVVDCDRKHRLQRWIVHIKLIALRSYIRPLSIIYRIRRASFKILLIDGPQLYSPCFYLEIITQAPWIICIFDRLTMIDADDLVLLIRFFQLLLAHHIKVK